MRWRGFLVGAALVVAWPAIERTAAAAEEQRQPQAASNALAERGDAEPASAGDGTSTWLLVPVVSSSPKLGTAFGGLGAYLHVFDPGSRVSMFGVMYQYTSTDSSIATVFARTSFGADHHRIVGLTAFGYVKNDYQDYLGSGQPLKTNDDLKAAVGRYLYRAAGNWFVGGQGLAANYQVFGESTQDDLVLETLGLRGFKSVALGAVVMHDSRDNEDMPRRGWFLNLNNFASREGLGGQASFDAYRANLRVFWPQGRGHLMAFRQNNWFTHDAPAIAQATVILRGYKLGQYLAPYMSSFEAEERLLFGSRWGATVVGGVAGLYGERGAGSANRQFYPTLAAGLQFIVKPAQRMLVNLEYAQGVEDNHGIYLKFGYGW